MSLEEIIKTDKTSYKKKRETGNKKLLSKGGARQIKARNTVGPRLDRGRNQAQRNQQNVSFQKNRQNLKTSKGGKRANSRPVLRLRKTGAAPPPVKNIKSITQKVAIQRLNKARASLQKAMKGMTIANKKLASTIPAKKSPAMLRRTSAGANNGRFKANRQTGGYNNRENDRETGFRQRGRNGTRGRGAARGRGQQNHRVERRPNNAIQKRTQKSNINIKIRNKGPSGRGRGKVSVIRDTLKKEKPATSLDDRFSQLLKAAGRTANRGRGGNTGRGRGPTRGGRGRAGNSSQNRQRF